MKTLGNIIWLIFGGIESAILCFLVGLICCLTIVLMPIGIQLFKLGEFTLAPFGRNVMFTKSTTKAVINVIYFILFGWELVLFTALIGIFYCISIIGIPYGLQFFKISKFAFMPLGARFGYKQEHIN